ncbi:ribonuclease E activity regulator RraA [Oceanisphaera psychrotolerans]|uniref:4-hydroxy-4-methyl-2-oxoglutarate aldolase n=1 Tax=Oceanisphaera psychrotolerans TaxID=1414654 RepID=A0A1J4QFC2_9GAMM|nr:ribonuclease E activity regulator RraA [Oceanisphaera psychrotolerans]OIN12192.1 ribonuclease activity regulator protein RraA [Oceanisphaera psychrotolerans]
MNTTDLCDLLGERIGVLTPLLRDLGGRPRFAGEVVTVKCFEDSSRIKELIVIPGQGKVLVVDAGGSERCAVFGDMSAATAIRNGWEGVVIYGYIRDAEPLAQMDLGMRALGVVPMGSTRRGLGLTELAIDIQGVRCHPGDYLVADENGVVVIPRELTSEALTAVT